MEKIGIQKTLFSLMKKKKIVNMCYLSIDLSLQNGKYIIKSHISRNSLCLTYQAVQTALDRIVTINEFYMQELCSRKSGTSIVLTENANSDSVEFFRRKFLSNAKSMTKDEDGRNIKVFDIFEENDTAYYVFLGNDDANLVEPQNEKNALTEESKEIDLNIEETNDDTTKELSNIDIEIVELPKKRDSFKLAVFSSVFKHLCTNNKKTIFICVGLATIGFVCASLFITFKSNDADFSKEDSEYIDTLATEEAPADSVLYDNDMQGEEKTEYSQQEFEKYISLSNEWLEKSKHNIHKPSNVRNILNARYFYYDKADKINYVLRNERLPAQKEIDELTEQEYQYWVNEARKLGSKKNNYALKRTYLKRAKSLAMKHQNILDSQIKWLDEQIDKKNH